MSKGYTRPSIPSDIEAVVADMREADVAELHATGETPEGALRWGLLSQAFGGSCKTICLPDGHPVGMFGVTPSSGKAGLVWMLAANGIREIHRQFLRECQGEIAAISDGYRVLYNYTDSRNSVHHRWLKWAGFTFIKQHENYGVDGTPFIEFVKITEGNHV